jgi:hypothetical protein
MHPGADIADLASGLATRAVYPRRQRRLESDLLSARPRRSPSDMELSPELLADPFGTIRSRCAAVAARARHVHIDGDALARFAARIPVAELGAAPATHYPDLGGDPERIAAFAICLDAINFGSGWFPQLVKPQGRSGYRTVEAALAGRFRAQGAPSADELRAMDAAGMTALLGQQHAGPDVPALMELYALAWRQLGAWLALRGSFLAAVRSAGGSAAALVRALLEMPLYRDVLPYDGLEVPFLKRAQITAADLALALPEQIAFRDLDQLTLFADNLVPHVLRIDGVLEFEPALVARIEREELLAAGSPEEVEIRACAVTAVERLRGALGARGARVRSMDLDSWLWTRGGRAEYKAHPRHRARCSFY